VSDIFQFPDRAEILIKSLLISAASEELPPFAVDAFVVEEDTFLVMSPNDAISEEGIDMKALKQELSSLESAAPGTVLVKEGEPLLFLAVVYEFEQEPHWKEEWIADALENIFGESERKQLSSISLPLIGTLHGGLKKRRFAEILSGILKVRQPVFLKNIWVQVDAGTEKTFLEMLKEEAEKTGEG
jgi:hypothetical protein